MYGTQEIGTITFDSTNEKVTINFDGDVLSDDGISNATCAFGAEFQYDGDNDGIAEGSTGSVIIMGQSFTVRKPVVPIKKNISKSGAEQTGGTILWTVNVNAYKKAAGDVSLDGYVFKDDLSGVGTFVTGTFKVGNQSIPDSSVYDGTSKLDYTFGSGSSGPQVITFETKIPEDKLVVGGTVNNTASFGLSDTDKVSETGTVNVKKKFSVEKNGQEIKEAVYDPSNQTVEWTIKVTPKEGIGLKNVSVEDVIPADWTFVSAEWEWADSAQTSAGITLPSKLTGTKPGNDRYELNNGTTELTTPVNLVITTKMPPKSYVGSKTEYANKAKLYSTGITGADSNEAKVGVGIDGITKTASNIDYANRQILWNVDVDLEGQTVFDDVANNIKVYDLVIYGDSFDFANSNLSTLAAGATANDINPRYGQKFVDNSFDNNGNGSLSYEIKPVTVNGVEVGQLLIVHGFGVNKTPFGVKTQVLDPTVFAANGSAPKGTGNASVAVQNDASLFYKENYLNRSTGTANYESNVLSKQVMNVDGTAIGNAADSFNHEDKTAVFRLNVNPDGYNLTGAQIPAGNGVTKSLGNVKIVDTLPAGWSFVDLEDGVKYKVYNSSDNTLVGDVSSIIEGTPGFDNSARTATFVFKDLQKSYYILVKAKLSEEEYANYWKTNNGEPVSSKTVTNDIRMTADGDNSWGVARATDVTIGTEFLKKQLDVTNGELPKWTVTDSILMDWRNTKTLPLQTLCRKVFL
ncbi:MAG: hypothetical protein QM793_09150 [Muricomes sp.]